MYVSHLPEPAEPKKAAYGDDNEIIDRMETCAQPLMTWSQWHPPVGAFIAVLALLGVIVPWLYREPKDMKAPEKALWTFVMLLLFGLELRTLYLDRDQHDREQEAANCE